jgi:hypothetical protein
MYLVLQQICSEFGVFHTGKKYQLAKVPKAVIEDWLTQTPPLIEKLKLSEMTREEKQEEPLDTVNEEPIEDEPSGKKKKKYSDTDR